ncbi:MAG: lactoylglutathione lyase [Verrucomicrobiales bacterium]|jgi:lactoylglutathione lyase
MPQLSEIYLDVSDSDRNVEFYVETLGMRLVDENDRSDYSLSYESGAKLKLRQRKESARYDPTVQDAYWKIGISIADVDIAREQLLKQNIEVTQPQQFLDIGYLCHFDDPDGYCIELLQHRFESNHRPRPPVESEPLGNKPIIGQVSLNVASIEDSLAFYRDRLGLNLLSRQKVPSRGFTLYFLGDCEEKPPSDDVDAVEIREWLWQLRSTVLELRAFDDDVSDFTAHPPDSELGFRGIGFTNTEAELALKDPDGVDIFALRKDV